MKPLEQPLKPKWWRATDGYKTYHLREFSGILIAVWCLYYLNIPTWFGLTITNPWYGYMMNTLGLAGAVIHSSTWLSIMPKLTPFNLNAKQQQILFGILILVWLGVSALVLQLFWS